MNTASQSQARLYLCRTVLTGTKGKREIRVPWKGDPQKAFERAKQIGWAVKEYPVVKGDKR